MVLEPDGIQQWYYGEIRGRNMGLNAVAGKPREMYNIDASRYDEMRPGCFNVDERVRDMNAGGQLAGLNFPNFTGFSGQVLNQGPDRDVNLVMIKAYNDWHVDEWCAAYPGRFIPCGILPLFDVAEAAKEVNRLADKGCHAVTFSENPEALQMPSIHTKYWYPLFEAVCENKTVLCTHVGSASRSPQVSTDAPPSVQMTASSMMSMFTFTELIWAEFWADFPQLKFSLTEGDVGWIPYFLWRAEHVYNRHSGWTLAKFPPGYSGPTDVFKRHFYTCFISDKVGVQQHGLVQRGHAVLGVRLPALRQQLAVRAGGRHRRPWAISTTRSSTRSPTKTPWPPTHSIRSSYIPKEHARAGYLRAQATDVDVVTHVGRQASQRDRDAWTRMTQFALQAQADAGRSRLTGIAGRATTLGN